MWLMAAWGRFRKTLRGARCWLNYGHISGVPEPGEFLTRPDSLETDGEVRSRLIVQSTNHWHEFSVVIASGAIVLLVTVAGVVVLSSADIAHKFLALAMLGVTAMAVGVAYFSIQVGSVLVTKPLILWDVFSAIAIATTQISMLLWLGHSIRAKPDDVAYLGGWFAGLAAFAIIGRQANVVASAQRLGWGHPSPTLERFEQEQQTDRRGAELAASAALASWMIVALASHFFGEGWALVAGFVGTGFAATGIGKALMSLDRSSRSNWQDLVADRSGPTGS